MHKELEVMKPRCNGLWKRCAGTAAFVYFWILANVPTVASAADKGKSNATDTGVTEVTNGIKKKPAPDSVYEVLTKLKTKKEDAVYIGDSDVDFATSVNAGMDVIMVGWGFRDEEFLREKGAKRIIKQPSEILDIILGED